MRCSTSRRPSSGVRLVTDNKCAGMLGALEEVFRGGTLPTQHGAFLPQRTGAGAHDRAEGRGAHAEGDPRAGLARGMRQKGQGGGGVDHEWGKRRHLDMSKPEEMDRPNKTVGDQSMTRTGPNKSICERTLKVPPLWLRARTCHKGMIAKITLEEPFPYRRCVHQRCPRQDHWISPRFSTCLLIRSGRVLRNGCRICP